MKKIIAIVSSLFFVTITTANADMGIGISGAIHQLDASGTETTRTSGEVNRGSHEETAVVPEIFVEAIADSGFAIGLAYIPTRELGSKSRSDSNSDGDTGTYTAKAELENVFSIYTDIPMGSLMYAKLGIQHVTLATLETLNSGSAYPNKDILGATIGLGAKGDLPYGNMYYKGEVTYTNFESYEGVSVGNSVNADLEDIAARLSIGYRF